MLSWALSFAGMTLAYTVCAFAVAVILSRVAGRRVPPRALPALFLILFFILLTQTPVPDPATMICPRPEAKVNLVPFRFVLHFFDLQARGDSALTDRTVMTGLANLVICGLIGAALLPFLDRPVQAAGVGLALSGLVELTQLTGVFGLFPCPYREFDVDDLILNVAGVWGGYVIARALQRRFSRRSQGAGH